jgi:hypothetical protein
MTGPAGRQGKPARVNIIRTFFEGRNRFAEFFPRGNDSDGNDGFTGSTSQSRRD